MALGAKQFSYLLDLKIRALHSKTSNERNYNEHQFEFYCEQFRWPWNASQGQIDEWNQKIGKQLA